MTTGGPVSILACRKEAGMEGQEQEMEWGDEWFALPWDEDDYQKCEEREWGRAAWIEDILVPLDSIESVG